MQPACNRPVCAPTFRTFVHHHLPGVAACGGDPGYLHVPGPFRQNSFSSLNIHYQFHTSMNDPKADPIATW